MNICPWCLYELEGLLKHGNPQPCPECGEQVSSVINLTAWGRRARWIPLYKAIVFGWTGFVILWSFIVFGILIAGTHGLTQTAEGFFYDLLSLSVPVFALAMPFVVFGSCYRWIYLRDPSIGAGKRLLISIVAVSMNLVTALLFILPLLGVF